LFRVLIIDGKICQFETFFTYKAILCYSNSNYFLIGKT